jgi:N-acetylglucosamine kinase-like BadF-type ATPase
LGDVAGDCRAGTVLISGTGAVAASIQDGEMTAVADGLGWLLGDRGSGFWLGREAVISVARELYAGRPPSLLGTLIVPAVLGAEAVLDVDALVIAVHNDRPQRLAKLAPLVVAAADQGDPLALDIATRAAAELVATVAEIRRPGDTTPIVLAGSVLRHATAISEPVTRLLQARWPAAHVVISAPGEHGAAQLARRHPTLPR